MNASTIAKNKKSAIRYFSGLLEGYENRAEIPAYGTISADEKCEDNQIIRKLVTGQSCL